MSDFTPYICATTKEGDLLHFISQTMQKICFVGVIPLRHLIRSSIIDPSATRAGIVALMPRLRRFARSLTGNLTEADDLVQIAIERALRHLDQFEAGTRLDSWLFRVLKNAWIDEIRHRRRRDRVMTPDDGADAPGEDFAAHEARQELKEVERAMQTLPEDQRVVIALICVEGLSYAEASEVLDVPVGTLSSRLTRGREALLTILGGRA